MCVLTECWCLTKDPHARSLSLSLRKNAFPLGKEPRRLGERAREGRDGELYASPRRLELDKERVARIE